MAMILPSGIKRRAVYDAAGQTVSLIEETSRGAVRQRLTFSYDANGNRTGIEDSNGARTTYAYDAKDRLTGDDTSGANAHEYDYEYDADENRTFSTERGADERFHYDASSRLTTSSYEEEVPATITTYTYDADGNLVGVATEGASPVTMT